MIVRLRGRVCSHLDCTLSGWLGSCEPSFLPSPPPSCVCASSPHPAAPGPACVPRRAPGTSRDFTVDAEAGTAAWSRGLIAHLVLSWLARQPVGGALHTTPRAAGLQGLPGIPEGWEAGARVPAAVLAPPGLDLECKGCRGCGAPVRVALVPTNTESKSKFSPTWEFSPLLPVPVVVQWLSRVCLCDPMDSAHQTSLSFTISPGVCVKVAQSCPTLCDPVDYTVLEFSRPAVPFSRGSSQSRDWTGVSCIAGGFFTNWAIRVAHLLEFAQTHIHWVSVAIQSSHSLLSPFPPAFNLSQHQGLL